MSVFKSIWNKLASEAPSPEASPKLQLRKLSNTDLNQTASDSYYDPDAVSTEEFVIDFETEEALVKQEASLQEFQVIYNSLGLFEESGHMKTEQNVDFLLPHIASEDASGIYSSVDKNDIVIITRTNMLNLASEIVLANLTDKTIYNKINKRDLEGIAILTYTVAFRRKRQAQARHGDIIMVDLRRFPNLSQYLVLYYGNYIQGPSTSKPRAPQFLTNFLDSK